LLRLLCLRYTSAQNTLDNNSSLAMSFCWLYYHCAWPSQTSVTVTENLYINIREIVDCMCFKSFTKVYPNNTNYQRFVSSASGYCVPIPYTGALPLDSIEGLPSP